MIETHNCRRTRPRPRCVAANGGNMRASLRPKHTPASMAYVRVTLAGRGVSRGFLAAGDRFGQA